MSFANPTSSEISAAVYSISVTASDLKFPWAVIRSILSWRVLTIVGWIELMAIELDGAKYHGPDRWLTILHGSGLLSGSDGRFGVVGDPPG